MIGKYKANWADTRSTYDGSDRPLLPPTPSARTSAVKFPLLVSFPDKVRGVLNEGGLFGERQGWHLPEFDTSKWTSRSLSSALPSGAGVGFFITTFDLNIPTDTDVPISFVFDGGSTATTQPYRALLFVNGWMMGKRVGNLGFVD